MNIREDIDPQGSQRGGLLGFYEATVRRSKNLGQILTTLPLYLAAVALMGLALSPGVAIYGAVARAVLDWPMPAVCMAHGLAIAAGYFVYGFTLLVLVALANLPLRPFIKPVRGTYYSLQFVPWYAHNALLYIVRYTFLDFVTPTPVNIAFLKAMGMKIGRNCQVNTSLISDPALLTLEDKVTIGGSATIIAHYGMGGYLILAPVIIRKGATVGLRVSILGGVEIGARATVMPNSVVLPKTKIPDGEIWGGVPAVKIK